MKPIVPGLNPNEKEILSGTYYLLSEKTIRAFIQAER